MPTKLVNFICSHCEHQWEFLQHGQDQDPEDGCPQCGSKKFYVDPSGGRITKCHDPDVLKETLQRRSAEHTMKGVQKLAGHRGSLPKNFGRKGSQIGD